jgi:hypothetical protein
MPTARKRPQRNDVERRIHFYRADCGRNKQGELTPFSPGAGFKHIDGLSFAPFAEAGGRYYEEDDNIYCCWPESATRAQFAVIRRDALPTIEEKGIRTALNLSATAGLVEAIHVRIFPDNIVGFDFNFYGPRLSRLGRYLNVVAEGIGPDVVFEPLLRQDVVADLQGGKELRMFSLRIRRSEVETIEGIDQSLGGAFAGIAGMTEADELEIIVRPTAYSKKSIGTKLLTTTRKLAKRNDLRSLAETFRVNVAASPGAATQTLDLLGDHFIVDVRILRQFAKGRALEPADAYTKIEQAYAAKKTDLEKAASLA